MRFRSFIIPLFVASLLVQPASASAHQDDHDMFYDDLARYGEWMPYDDGVLVWRPAGMHRHWRPYSEGRWVWTDYGWYWASAEPFGWAVFHYGRWMYDVRFGWIWFPGRVWGPAWVEWRYSDAYIGWAPLPPYAVFHVSFGVRFSRPWTAPVGAWCFVDYGSFGHVVRYRSLASAERVHRIIGTTRRGSSTIIERDRIVNRGVDRSYVQRRSGASFGRYDIDTNRDRGEERVREGRVESYRPGRDESRYPDRNAVPDRPASGRWDDRRPIDRSRPDIRMDAPRQEERPQQQREWGRQAPQPRVRESAPTRTPSARSDQGSRREVRRESGRSGRSRDN